MSKEKCLDTVLRFLVYLSGLWCEPGLSLQDSVPDCGGLICYTSNACSLLSIYLATMYTLNVFT